jgi:hypothetical protein
MTASYTTQPANFTSDYRLSEAEIGSYRKNGHVLLRGVLAPAEARSYLPVIGGAVDALNTERRPLEERSTYDKAFLQTMNLWRRDPAVVPFSLARRFAGIAARLLGVPAVRMYHDQALFKEPGGGFTPWHQDHTYWPIDTDRMLTLWMPLDDVTEDMGIMRFASGSHLDRPKRVEISDESEQQLSDFVQERRFPVAGASAMRAGDCTFHASWTLHSAPANTTDRMRPVMTVIYFADGARALEPDSEPRKRDLQSWLPGVSPGELAASELNPVVYS